MFQTETTLPSSKGISGVTLSMRVSAGVEPVASLPIAIWLYTLDQRREVSHG